ncbi:MAG: hypothetical protein AAB906_00040 [Patescibacteria group bacterium]
MQTTNLQDYFDQRREDAEGDAGLEAKLQEEIQNHRRALMEANRYGARIGEDILRVGEFAGDRIAETLGGVITVDKVGFKSYDELLYLYLHEGLHKKGIHSEGLAQAAIKKHGPAAAQARAREDYIDEQLAVEEVTRRIGTDTAVQLYEQKEFTKMLSLFKYVCTTNENMSEEEAVQIFFKAYQEFKFQETIH